MADKIVRMKTSMSGPNFSIRPRQLAKVDARVAKVWIENGMAEEPGDEPVRNLTFIEPAKRSTATATKRETAATG